MMDAIRLLEEYEANHLTAIDISELELLPTVPTEAELEELYWAERQDELLEAC